MRLVLTVIQNIVQNVKYVLHTVLETVRTSFHNYKKSLFANFRHSQMDPLPPFFVENQENTNQGLCSFLCTLIRDNLSGLHLHLLLYSTVPQKKTFVLWNT